MSLMKSQMARMNRTELRLNVVAQNSGDEGSLDDDEFRAFMGLKWLLDPDGEEDSRRKVVSLALTDTLLRHPGRLIPIFSQFAGRTARMLVQRELRRRMRPMVDLLDFHDETDRVSLVPFAQEEEYRRRIEEENDGERTD